MTRPQTPPTAAEILLLDQAEEILRRLGDPPAAAQVRDARVGLEAYLTPEASAEVDAGREAACAVLAYRQKVQIYSLPNTLSPPQREALILLGSGQAGWFTLRSLGKRAVSARWLVGRGLAALGHSTAGPVVKLTPAGCEVFTNIRFRGGRSTTA